MEFSTRSVKGEDCDTCASSRAQDGPRPGARPRSRREWHQGSHGKPQQPDGQPDPSWLSADCRSLRSRGSRARGSRLQPNVRRMTLRSRA